TRGKEERAQADARATQAEREREAAATERIAAETARKSVQMELDLRTKTEDDARDRLSSERDRLRALESTVQEQAERQRALAGERVALERDVADLRTQVAALTDRRQQGEREHSAARQRADEARKTLEMREHEDREAQAALE